MPGWAVVGATTTSTSPEGAILTMAMRSPRVKVMAVRRARTTAVSPHPSFGISTRYYSVI